MTPATFLYTSQKWVQNVVKQTYRILGFSFIYVVQTNQWVAAKQNVLSWEQLSVLRKWKELSLEFYL